MAGWFKFPEAMESNDEIRLINDYGNSVQAFQLKLVDDGGVLRCQLTGNAATSVLSGGIAYTSWHFVAVTYVRGGTVELNIDGASVGSFTDDNTNTNGDGMFRMGTYVSFAGTPSLLVDEWGVWQRVLDSGEIDLLYNSGTPPGYESF